MSGDFFRAPKKTETHEKKEVGRTGTVDVLLILSSVPVLPNCFFSRLSSRHSLTLDNPLLRNFVHGSEDAGIRRRRTLAADGKKL